MAMTLVRMALVFLPILVSVACVDEETGLGPDSGLFRDAGADSATSDAEMDADSSLGTCTECTFDALEALADPYLPARALPGRMRLASSRQPEPIDGMGNDDHTNFVHVAGGEYVLLEAEGPGVVARLWFTGREPATRDYTVLDRTVLHIAVDGREVPWADDHYGIALSELTSGTVEGFPRPWVAGRDTASNGFLLAVPIAFAESLRLWIEPPPGEDTFFYYQVDWRELPRGTELESFDGRWSAREEASLREATRLWIDHADSAASSTATNEVIPAGRSLTLPLAEATTVRTVAVDVTDGRLEDLVGYLQVDGRTVVQARLAQWAFALPPTQPYDSALTTVGERSVRFRYPFPVRRSAQLRLRNTASTSMTVRAAFEHDPGTPEDDLGALRMTCLSPSMPERGQNVSLLEVYGRRGHYAGQLLVFRSQAHRFWRGMWGLEGDHEVIADSEHLMGTGMEDYFGGSFYYLRGRFTHPLCGASGIPEVNTPMPELSQFRHHLLDTIPFERNFQFTYETYIPGTKLDYCALWYEDFE